MRTAQKRKSKSTDRSVVRIGGQPVGQGHAPMIIAELSANHAGSLDRALALVDAAHKAGAHAIKLQTYTPDTLTIDHEGPGFVLKNGPWKGRKLYDLYAEAHLPWDWHKPIFQQARKLGLIVFSTPFDETAVDFLEDLDVPAYKIASFELVHHPLIQCVARTGKPMIMSTGMASHDEIGEAVDVARRAGARNIVLLHCTSGYPTPANEAQLMTIPQLRTQFHCPVGLSDHTTGIAVPVAATALGVCLIEKHFTLDRRDGGPDSEFSLEPAELKAMVDNVDAAWQSLAAPHEGATKSEASSIGLRRSIYVVTDLRRGDRFTKDNIRVIRPGHGLAPRYMSEVLGRSATSNLKRGTPLAEAHVQAWKRSASKSKSSKAGSRKSSSRKTKTKAS